MILVLLPAAALTLATLLPALAWRGVLALARRPAPRFLRRALIAHAALLALHVLVTVPLALGFLARVVTTRGDEQAWRGPRLDGDGNWQVQTRESLAAERERPAATDGATGPAPDGGAGEHALFFPSRDGVRLRAFLVPHRGAPAAPPAFAAVLVHGLYRGGLELEPVGAMLRDLGGEVLLLELRNHGGSGRARPTFGLDESQDVLAAVDVLRRRPEAAGRPLVLFAVSVGTAAAALAAPAIPDLAGLVLDAPLDDLGAVADRMLRAGSGGRRGPGLPQPFRALVLWSARNLAGAPLDEVRPAEALRRLPPRVPVLLIGAGHDVRVPPERVRALFDRLPTEAGRKELWIVPEAEHGRVWFEDPDGYRERLARFVAELRRP